MPQTAAFAEPHTRSCLTCGTLQAMVKTTVYLPEDLRRELQLVAKERGMSGAELIRTAIRHELLRETAGQRAEKHARLLAAIGSLDRGVFPDGYLDEIRTG